MSSSGKYLSSHKTHKGRFHRDRPFILDSFWTALPELVPRAAFARMASSDDDADGDAWVDLIANNCKKNKNFLKTAGIEMR
ncbi:hypothetical protein C6366_15535 [Desulfonatronum sp. SC1]|nr:hypothetical protein C6366_15535 [Desulfonatronum sp. SC1]